MANNLSWARRIWRNLYWWRQDRQSRLRYRGIKRVIYFGGDGLGDELLCSVPLHELRRRGVNGLCAMTNRPEFFLHSPDVDAVRAMAHIEIPFLERIGVAASSTVYIHEKLPPDIDVPPPHHIIAEMCRLSGIRGEIELRPWLWLSDSERAAAGSFSGCVVVQSSRRAASLTIGNKEWDPNRFQKVVDVLVRNHRVVQLGLTEDPPLNGVEDLRGQKSLRESAAILANATTFIGLVGFLMHLARSVNCPAVIVYGGREHPDQSGYICNENLFTSTPCAPCWRWNSCDFAHACMTAIQPADVLAAFDRLLTRPRSSLAVAHATLP